MDPVKKRRYTGAEQRLALNLVVDAVRRGEIRTFKQLEKFGFVYQPPERPPATSRLPASERAAATKRSLATKRAAATKRPLATTRAVPATRPPRPEPTPLKPSAPRARDRRGR
jgi:hypothetical protein